MVIERHALEELIERLAELPARERASVPGIKPARADLILAGAIVVQSVLRGRRLRVAWRSPRRGCARASSSSACSGGRRAATGDRRCSRTSATRACSTWPHQYAVDAAHTEHVATLALGMFDELAALGLHEGDPRERELLWAACMLHDIGMSIDYDDHHKHSRYLILNGGLPGFAPVETAIIAQSARYHRKGMPSPGPMAALFGPGDAERLDRCATLLRLAEDLERSRDQLVREHELQETNGTVELRLVADGDSAVPSWAARRERELFERAFRRELRVAA